MKNALDMSEAWSAFDRIASEEALGAIFEDRREADRHRFLCGCSALATHLLDHWKREVAFEWAEFLTLVHAYSKSPEKITELAASVGDRERLEGPIGAAIDELARVRSPSVHEPDLFKGALALLLTRESRLNDPEFRAWVAALFEMDLIRARLTGIGATPDELAVRRGLQLMNGVRAMGPLFALSFTALARAA